MSDEFSMSIDGTTWFALQDLSIKPHTIDVTTLTLGGKHSMSIPTGAKTIEMKLPVHPFHPVGADFGGPHKLRIRHGEQVTVYDSYLYSAPSEIPGGAVRLKWHTAIQIPGGSGYRDSGRMLSKALPALSKQVLSPCGHYGCEVDLQNIIIHLNDVDKWSREQIADWLDTLDVDLAFPVPDTIPSNIN